ncbi:YkyB family protein [Sporosarcina thermotolerans]|uniref:YkyB family protein n=1 Tax=Sporosarcina thermotolerans TaxID=633404 RepID=A0AAW9A834_9BACL|nr:YkyB family protein [Sporosarcina thermotolerans]MDW0115903.1 YkyB family protein [Sporosarcina thermotolerans]
METESNIRQIAIAIYTVNRHAKTAPNNRVLYELKNSSIRKLLRLGYAQKIGLHFIENPQLSKQSSTVLVKCGDFLFHTLPEKEDFKSLPHLGNQDETFRNPQERMNLKTAKEILSDFIDEQNPPITVGKKRLVSPKRPAKRLKPRVSNTQSFRSSYLDGK